uniref:Uncharacterized protein n=1 Tax=viral metagenome TaxID=1070528 RepID=A0A6H1ZGM4_9ZZZZ
MPKKTVTSPKTAAPPEPDRLSKLESTVDTLATAINLLLQEKAPQKEETVENTPVQRQNDETDTNGKILPATWLAVLHKYLGKDFKFELHEGGPGAFGVKVIFPEHIDRRVGTERSTGPRDISMASPVRLTSPVDDLTTWCKLIVQTIKKTPDHQDFTPLI